MNLKINYIFSFQFDIEKKMNMKLFIYNKKFKSIWYINWSLTQKKSCFYLNLKKYIYIGKYF